MLLSQTLSRVVRPSDTAKGRIERAKRIARTIIPGAEIKRWKAKGYTVKRCCLAGENTVLFAIHVKGPGGFKDIRLTRTSNGVTGRMGVENLNGSTPATSKDVIELVDKLVG